MEKELNLISPIPPSVNHYLQYRVVKTKNRYLACSYKSKDTKNYEKVFEKYVRNEVKKQGWEIDELGKQHLYVDAVFYFPRIDMDSNNYFKVLLDTITKTKLVWKDDNIVCERVQSIYYDSENPRIEIKIHPTEYIGVFSSLNELSEFENKCKKCNRYNRNCSVLVKAKTGYVKEEIKKGNCLLFKEKQNKDGKGNGK